MKFTKDDLKVGHLIEYRNGAKRLVMLDKHDRRFLMGEDGVHQSFEKYTDELTLSNWEDLDVMFIWSRPEKVSCLLSFSTESRELLWERDERKEMTVAEIEKELGYSIKIVK